MAVGEIQLGVVDLGLIRANRSLQLIRGGLLSIHLLLRNRTGFIQQTLEARVVELSVLQLRLVAKQRRLRLIECDLERSRVDDS